MLMTEIEIVDAYYNVRMKDGRVSKQRYLDSYDVIFSCGEYIYNICEFYMPDGRQVKTSVEEIKADGTLAAWASIKGIPILNDPDQFACVIGDIRIG